MAEAKKFTSYSEFYEFYLAEHSDPVCRALHYIGTTIALMLMAYAIYSQTYSLILVAIVQGYAWAWVGHFVFEKNKPATFDYPFYSFISDFVMLKDFLLGKFRH
ncbi:DUF962 domain-containing protein [Maricurvus nonylphenolicus]|uniref:Mpo1-like protein n=1 Tax=Maricurvus nonylphenolicus TaxID=1008307 RepID=UPI0036F26A57